MSHFARFGDLSVVFYLVHDAFCVFTLGLAVKVSPKFGTDQVRQTSILGGRQSTAKFKFNAARSNVKVKIAVPAQAHSQKNGYPEDTQRNPQAGAGGGLRGHHARGGDGLHLRWGMFLEFFLGIRGTHGR